MQTKKRAVVPRSTKSTKPSQTAQKAPQEVLSLRVSPTLKSGLVALAKQRGVPLSRLLTRILQDHVKRVNQPRLFSVSDGRRSASPTPRQVHEEVQTWWARLKRWLS